MAIKNAMNGVAVATETLDALKEVAGEFSGLTSFFRQQAHPAADAIQQAYNEINDFKPF